MFRITEDILHQRALYSAWLKITGMILSCPLTQTRSVLWQLILTRFVCVCTCSSVYMKTRSLMMDPL